MRRISISNLAWSPADENTILRMLANCSVGAIEVAPTKIAPWSDLCGEVVTGFRRRVESLGMKISSIQAIFFGIPKAQLVSDVDSFSIMIEQLRRIFDIAEQLDAKIVVFGSPKNRLRFGLPPEAANRRAISRLQKIGDLASLKNVTVCLEPVPAHYGGDLWETWQDCLSVVDLVDHPNVKLQLDTNTVQIAGGDIKEAIRIGADRLMHFHAAERHLGDYSKPTADHAGAAQALAKIGYKGWVSIEMAQISTNASDRIRQAVDYVQSRYVLNIAT